MINVSTTQSITVAASCISDVAYSANETADFKTNRARALTAHLVNAHAVFSASGFPSMHTITSCLTGTIVVPVVRGCSCL